MTDARFGGVVREVLDGDTTATVQFGGIVREILLLPAPAPSMRKPWMWLRVVTAPEDFDGDPQAQWQPKSLFGLAPPSPKGRPYLMINS